MSGRSVPADKKTGQPGRASGACAGACGPRIPLPAGLLLLVCLGLSVSAFAARDFALVAAVAGAELALGFALRTGHRLALRILRLSLVQSTVIVGLYLLRFGLEPGAALTGLRVSCQIVLALAPGMMALRCVPHSQMMRSLNRVMPSTAAFVLATSLRFMPLLRSELRSILEAQTLRGARIAPADLRHPRHWPDFVHCLLVPFIVQCFKMAGEIATAARIRNFGATPKRTFWPGDRDGGGGSAR